MRVLLLVFLLGPRFEGCGGDAPGDTPLPREDVELCFSDADCDTGECADIRCLAGSCTRVADVLDRDGDGEPPLRCGGTDCDDGDAQVFVGARETCNGVDDDCDMRIDEDAPGEMFQVAPPVFDASGVILPWGSAFAITDNQPGAIFGWPVALDGSFGDPIELMRLRSGSMFREVHSASNGEQTVLVATTDIGAVLYARIEGESVFEEGDLEHAGQVLELALVPHQGDFAIASDVLIGEEIRRFVRASLDVDAVDVGAGGIELGPELIPVPPDIASTGSDLVARVEEGLLFVDADVRIPAPDDTARQSIASATERVVVGFNDGFGLAVQYFDASGALGSPQPGPATRTDETDLVSVEDGIGVFARTDIGSRGAWVLDDTLTRYVRTFIDLGGDVGVISSATLGNASAYYGAGAADPRITLLLECE